MRAPVTPREDGFEIYIPADEATSARVWNEILEAGKEFGVVPCGLGSRNTLRLEGSLSLYGHEISDTINVWEAGLDRFCKMEKPEFIGRAALEKAKAAGLKRTLVGLEMIERGIARDGYKFLRRAGQRDWLHHQWIAGTVSEKKYCVGLRAAGIRGNWIHGEG